MEFNLTFVYFCGRISCTSAVFHTVGGQHGLSKVNLAAEDQWLSCCGGVTTHLVKSVAVQTCQLLRRLWQYKCIWPVKTLTASNSFTALQGVMRRKRLRQMEVKESVKLSILLSKRQQECKLSPGNMYISGLNLQPWISAQQAAGEIRIWPELVSYAEENAVWSTWGVSLHPLVSTADKCNGRRKTIKVY